MEPADLRPQRSRAVPASPESARAQGEQGEPVCCPEDLFVDPAHRGPGAGRRLLEDLFDLAAVRGWARVHWLTAHDNPARRPYDPFVPADRFVHYERDLPAGPAPADRPRPGPTPADAPRSPRP
ncbi:GNAT family N-acetyltransferase [Kitasatospora purpeofusca]|uniref:GNAT family N-acetyltransferase n=1 Tax=Kitasatospora purpeofusca TaxID=67352 RepID=UPI0035E0B7A2